MPLYFVLYYDFISKNTDMKDKIRNTDFRTRN